MPEKGKKIEIFGKSRAEQMAAAAHAPLLAQLPLDPEMVKLCDEGNVEQYGSEVVTSLGKSLIKALTAEVK